VGTNSVYYTIGQIYVGTCVTLIESSSGWWASGPQAIRLAEEKSECTTRRGCQVPWAPAAGKADCIIHRWPCASPGGACQDVLPLWKVHFFLVSVAASRARFYHSWFILHREYLSGCYTTAFYTDPARFHWIFCRSKKSEFIQEREAADAKSSLMLWYKEQDIPVGWMSDMGMIVKVRR
jgi:hypothetical protein